MIYREEPLIYINGVPYVLRLEAVGLRNLKSYAGISSPRLELLEDRLKSDILAELRTFDGRILLHTETHDGSVIGVWETATESAVKTLREVMNEKSESLQNVCKLDFKRQPITAEKAPDFEDIKDLIGILACRTGRALHRQLPIGKGQVDAHDGLHFINSTMVGSWRWEVCLCRSQQSQA